MSKRPRKTVTDNMRSKTVLYRSADVLQHIAICLEVQTDLNK